MNEPEEMHIETKYIEYTEVIKKISEKEIQKQYHRLLTSANTFINEMGYADHVVCDKTLLMFAVLGYCSDIIRLKDFHNIKEPLTAKILAYETSWLIRRKPLQLKDGNDLQYAFCNEQFALSQLMTWFAKSEDERGNEVIASDELEFFSNMLFYYFKYRDNDAQALELMLVSFMAGRKYQRLLLEKKRTQ